MSRPDPLFAALQALNDAAWQALVRSAEGSPMREKLRTVTAETDALVDNYAPAMQAAE